MVLERWRYVMPCGHHYYNVRPSHPPSKRYYCRHCRQHFAEDELIDKKTESTAGIL